MLCTAPGQSTVGGTLPVRNLTLIFAICQQGEHSLHPVMMIPSVWNHLQPTQRSPVWLANPAVQVVVDLTLLGSN